MPANIQVPQKMIADVMRLLYELDENGYTDDACQLCVLIQAAITDKIERMQRHESFSAYKTAPPGAGREQNRRAYLEFAGVHTDFICSREVPNGELK